MHTMLLQTTYNCIIQISQTYKRKEKYLSRMPVLGQKFMNKNDYFFMGRTLLYFEM